MHQKHATPRSPHLLIKNWLTTYFSLTKREYNALLVLFGLISLTIVTPYFYEKFFIKEQLMTSFETKAIRELSIINEKTYRNNASRYNHANSKEFKVRTSLFKFDPNQIGMEDWKRLGLSTKQAQSIINYRDKGGRFYKTEDLKKMYAVSPAMFERLHPYIELPDRFKKEDRNFEAKSFPKKEMVIIEINSADTINLDKIKGVGAAFARRIVNYRQRLGGFYKKEQLMEVYGVDSLKFEEIKSQIQIDPSIIKKIDINRADFEALKNHPYLKYKQINAIIQYRKQHGDYMSIADLKKVLILSSQTIEQLTPYLQF